MGTFTFRLPDIGEGIAEAEIVAWHVKVGDRIEEDGPIADMMTDKATVEMESPVTGVVREVAGEVGDTVAIGSPLVVIETEGGEAYAEPEPVAAAPEPEPAPARAEPVEVSRAAPAASGKGRFVFRLPDIGEGIAEAEIVAWHVKVGDRIEEDGPIADMMTDKATVEMESPVSGVVLEVAGDVGATVAIGSPLVVIEIEGGGLASVDELAERIEAENTDAGDADRVIAARPEPTAKPAPAKPAVPARTAPGGKALASPAVRARARSLGVDLAAVSGGLDGVVRHEHLDAYMLAQKPAAPAQTTSAAKPEAKRAPEQAIEGAGEAIKVIGLRRRIAENMAASKRHIPHFTYVDECDVTELERWRVQFNDQRGDKPKLTLLPFLITAICRTLPEFPMINARYDEDANVVTRYDSVHLGMAAQTPAGLMVPVIRNAQNLTLWALAAEIARLAEAAREGTAKSEELSGSTLTVTSLGPLGGIATTPVINRPEVAIIGPNKIVERPVYVPDGQGGERIEKRKLMNVSISCDHRVVDGWDAASFIQALKRRIEAPLLMLAG
ncbi:2-oxo acid dehydrogenase subunit E2 [Novosphingobium sp. JCM 18896]|uniref:2-oxo acid dehydrogenase subunit E2 n=1 Tax=Novosphingobium sp. JCM 18896 TaxID=2989731 RepID=UPI002222AD61|nr:2-oxo acid dehydrogenase subunit E2 [Novosphingobium sp. JCM 18896]MCW1431127.1 2-oxo acid dehydrogenase subunit E2 [Novosphingobium sp. JCM 18896]